MSEHAPKNHERFTAPKGVEHEAQREAAPEHTPHHEKKERLAPLPELEQKAKQEAIAHQEPVGKEKATHAPSELYVNQELKEQTWNRSMTRVRKHLSAPNRAFSKVIHQPVVDSVSRVSEKTIARPSGLLTGSIFAFLGSSFFLWMANHYGFEYNYLLFFLFFIGGFAVGLVVEMLLFVFRRKKV